MKTTILLLLFTTALMGQEKEWTVPSDNFLNTSVEQITFFRINPSGIIELTSLEAKNTAQLFLSLLDEYAAECYADSTLYIEPYNYPREIEADSNGVIDLTKSITVPAVYMIRKIWRHREPTFLGFRKFLRKKLKSTD